MPLMHAMTHAALMLATAASPAPQAEASPRQAPARQGSAGACTIDGLVHAEVSAAITERVARSIRLTEPGARLRDVARLTLPCGFRVDSRYGFNLVLTNGTETRRYVENNAFGFAPAFGFGEQAARSYTLSHRPGGEDRLHADECTEALKGVRGAPRRCGSFGNPASFFGALPAARKTRVAHYVVKDGTLNEDFAVAEVAGEVESIAFIPPPDAPGGTITLVLTDRSGTYRAYLDTPRG